MKVFAKLSRLRHVPQAALFRLWLKRQRARGRTPLVFFERRSGLGDVICTFPVLEALRAQHPRALIVYATAQAFVPVVRMNPAVDAVVSMDWPKRLLEASHADYDIVHRALLEDEQLAGLAHVHLVDDFSRRIGVVPSDRQPHLGVPPALETRFRGEIARSRRGGGPVIGLHVGPSWPVRTWPLEHWNVLARRLREEAGAEVIQIGADFHMDTGTTSSGRVAGALDWVGKWKMEETVGVIKACDLLIGIDSGLLHVAGAVGTPSVGIFGPINPDLRMPPRTPSASVRSSVPCTGCHHRLPVLHWQTGCPYDIACMASIEPDRVYRAAVSLLRSGKSPAAPEGSAPKFVEDRDAALEHE